MVHDADYFDGRTSRRHPVSVDVSGGTLAIAGLPEPLSFPLDAVRLRPRIGRTPLRLTLPNGGLLVGARLEALAGALPAARETFAHRLESHVGVVALALVALPLAGWLLYRQAIPWIADTTAHLLPASIEQRIGVETLAALDDQWLGDTTLDDERRQQLADAFARLGSHAGLLDVVLVHRDGKAYGANAFALPGGTVVATDELIRELDDPQVVAILAHELGHVAHRHGMRTLLQSTMLFLVADVALGDVGGVTLIAASVPTMLAHLRYSRDHEREADAYAFELLRKAGRDPRTLGDALQRLERQAGADAAEDAEIDGALQYLSTHPLTAERATAAERAAVTP